MLSLSTSEASSCVVNFVSAMVLVCSCLCQIDHSLLLNTLPLIFASVKPVEGVLDQGVSGQPDYHRPPDSKTMKIQD